ncbi:hypothetical protein SAMN04488004_103239 [Loktanella salsilacus]|uniref:Uncharacterized protein n=1 Tax=Loktanella salsilacus TaxID=195913 RepID=A0A1I4D6M9_9RHOB|nr:hypothetical protein [Loktanella salsilacus]SFK88653.1 hypothetical protein SAMN04488004_103239 [Loktanella salsilacus]
MRTLGSSKSHGIISPEQLAEIEARLHAAWTGQGSTPFIVDIQPGQDLLDEAACIARALPRWRLFTIAPTLAVWAVLRALTLSYGTATHDVYIHINNFVGRSCDDPDRDDLKSRFRRAARDLGLPVSGNDPTNLFFAPLGPAHAQHDDLARAFVAASLHVGPPAIEDTATARLWQRRAVIERCPSLTRLRTTVFFDTSAHLARRFEAWRKNADPIGDTESHLFKAYDGAAKRVGRTKADLVGPPRLFWAGDRIGLEIEQSQQAQSLRLGAFPTKLTSGDRLRIAPPWGLELSWSAGAIIQKIAFGPAAGEALIFDADSGALLTRISADQQELEVAAERLVVLSAHKFSSPSFGEAIPAQDPNFWVAWVRAEETLSFVGRRDLSLARPREDALWIDGSVLGRDGSHALYACDGILRLKADPDVGGCERIIRMRIGNEVRYHSLLLDAEGQAMVPFSDLRLDAHSDPSEVNFEVLTPGAAGDLGARAALSTQCWIWPGTKSSTDDLADIPIPGNFSAARSAGLRVLDGLLSVDPHADQEAAILGLAGRKRVHEFQLVARGEKLWHYCIATNQRVFVPRGNSLLFGHDNRHDTLLLRSPDRDASLLVLGREIRRPFFQRHTIEIGAGQLEHPEGGDDRIALKRADGRVDILARIHRASDPSELELIEKSDEVSIKFKPSTPCRALVVRIEPLTSPALESEHTFDHSVPDLPPLELIQASLNSESGKIHVHIRQLNLSAPSRATFFLRDAAGSLHQLRDIRNAPIAIGLAGPVAAPSLQTLLALARFLSEPEAECLGGQLGRSLAPIYETTLDHVGASRMLGSVKSLLNVVRPDGQPPRHDIVASAPWILEAQPLAFAGLQTETGLAPLGKIYSIPSPSPAPDLGSDTPLSSWLDRVSADSSIPTELQVDKLQHGFRALRYRLKETDLHDIAGSGTLSGAVRLICGAHVEGLEQIRSFDINGGGDPLPARIAIQIERHARSCADAQATSFVDDIVFRTGLPRREVGQSLTLMLRAGVEIFAYFRALWGHASKNGPSSL